MYLMGDILASSNNNESSQNNMKIENKSFKFQDAKKDSWCDKSDTQEECVTENRNMWILYLKYNSITLALN